MCNKYALFLLCSCVFYNLNAQILLNELSGNSSNNDAENDGIVELINTTSTIQDIGCWVVSNSEWVVVLPPGTTLAANETFLIACGQAVSPNPSPGSGLTCATCDFPSMPIDFDVCLPGNSAYVDWAASGFTIDNLSPTDGDQIVLFQPDGTLIDAVQWGGGSRLTGVDNTTISGMGYGSPASYALGSSTALNGSGAATAQLPVALRTGGTCYNATTTYIMPAMDAVDGLGNPIYTNIGATQTSCNSSHTRKIGDTGRGASSWETTPHPSPGFVNDVLVEQFSVTGDLIQCGTPTSILITYEVFNWQNVEVTPVNTLPQPNGSPKTTLGSFLSLNGAAPIAWDNITRNNTTGITTLTYSFTPPANSSTDILAVWDDATSSPKNPNCCGTNTQNAVSSNECYSTQSITVVNKDIPTGSIAVNCDPITGTLTISGVSAFQATYSLLNDGIVQSGPQSSPSFVGITTPPIGVGYSVLVSNGCVPDLSASITPCIMTPACPNNLTIVGSTPNGAVCPGAVVNLVLDGDNLPLGAKVEWYVGGNPLFDPYLGEGTMIGEVTIPVPPVPTNPAAGSIVINEVAVRPATGDGGTGGEFVELFNIGPGCVDISCWVLSDGTGGAGSDKNYRIPAGTPALCAGEYFVVNWGTSSFVNSNEFLALWDNAGTLIASVKWGTGATDAPISSPLVGSCAAISLGAYNNASAPTPGNVPAGTAHAILSTTGWVWTTIGSSGAANPTNPLSATVPTNSCYDWSCASCSWVLKSTMPLGCATPPVFNYTMPFSSCNNTTDDYFRAIIRPIDASCSNANATSSVLNYTTICPEVTLQGGASLCAGQTTNLTLNAIGSVAGYTFEVLKDNVAITGSPFNDTNFPLTVGEEGIYTLGVINPSLGNCSASKSGMADISVNELPNLDLAAATANVCAEQTAIIPVNILAGNPLFNVSYALNGGSSNSAIISGDGNLYIPTAGLATGSYTVAISSIQDDKGCAGTSTNTATITVDPSPQVSTTWDCFAGTMEITDGASLGGTNTFELLAVTQDGGVPISIPQSNTTGQFNLPYATSATVQISNSLGCNSVPQTINFGCVMSLPVEYLYLNAQKQTQSVLLTWATYSELNNAFFEIEKSIDAINFEVIGMVNAQNTNESIKEYHFQDLSPAFNDNFYRLKQVDLDGSVHYSNILNVYFDPQMSSLSLYPNPTKDNVTLSFISTRERTVSLTVMDVYGKVCIEERIPGNKGYNQFEIPAKNLPSGVYYILLKNGTRILSQKMVKE